MRGIIGNSLEKHRETLRSPFIDGEKFVERCQAFLDAGTSMFASWRPGFLYLTPTRLLFYQGENQLLEIPLATARDVGIVVRRWVSKKTCDQLALTAKTNRGGKTVHFRVEPLEYWRALIERSLEEAGGDDTDRGN